MQDRFVGPLANQFGTYYPTGYVVGVLDSREQAEQAAQALRESGCEASQVRNFTGDEVLAIERRFREERSFGQKIAGMLASDEAEAQQQYLEAAERGQTLVTVLAPDEAEAQRVADILTAHDASNVRHYGPSVMTVFSPPRPA